MKQKIKDIAAGIPKMKVFAFYVAALAFTDLVPQLGAIDAMGTQWLYLAIINVLGLAAIWLCGCKDLKPLHNKVFVALGLLFLFCLLSVFSAVNRVESLVVGSRYLVSFGVIFLIYQLGDTDNRYMMRALGWAMSLVCMVSSFQILGILFYKVQNAGHGLINLEGIISADLTLNQGNKNFAASDLLQKIPFVFILLFGDDKKGRIAGYAALLLTFCTILILNTRSTYVGMGLLIVLVNIFLITRWWRTRAYDFSLVFFNVLFVAGFFAANAWLVHITRHQHKQKYANIIERAETIGNSGQSADRRLLMWGQAWDYVKKHPFTGCGIGNWKITAITYDRYLLEDYRIAKHTHNDFMEMAAETGVAGGAAYIVLFGLLLFILVRTMNRNRAGGRQDANLVVLALLTSLLMYIIDAFLNFPGERPCNQVNLAIAIGLIATLPTAFFKQPTKTTSKFILPLMGAVGLLLVFTSGLIYKSMRMQGKISSDYWQQSPRLGPDFVASGLGSFPDLTELCLPVNYIKARYYLLGNRESEGFNILYNDKNPNPAIGLREGLLAEYWASKAKYDSSLPYAKISVDKLPLCRSYMRVLAYGCIALKDSMALRKYFPPIIKATYGTKAVGNWRNYAAAYYECTGNKTATTAIIDSALAAFPAQPYLLKYKNVLKDFVPGGKPADTAPARQPASPDDVAYQKLQTKAKEFFKAQKYDHAMACFRQAASLKPKEYSNYENMGLLCLVKKEYAQSGIYFKKVIDAKAFENGKSEYYYAEALISMKQMEEGCRYAAIAVARGFPGAQELKAKYCK